MLIQVQYQDNRFDYVKEQVLHRLIESKDIVRFRRSSGWQTIGVDPVRQINRGFQNNPNSFNKPVVEVKNIIRVVYSDNRCDYVTDKTLDNLIESNKIAKFQRTTGWVTVGVDAIRKAKRENNSREPKELKESIL